MKEIKNTIYSNKKDLICKICKDEVDCLRKINLYGQADESINICLKCLDRIVDYVESLQQVALVAFSLGYNKNK